MPFLFTALYGLLSGFFDVLPVSSFAHQSILRTVFGVEGPLHLYNLFIHIASLGALIFASMPSITALMREQRILSLPRKRMSGDRKFTYELRFVKMAMLVAVFSSILILLIRKNTHSLLVTGILCVINGVLVLVPEYLPYGNKTAKHMNRLDSAAFGMLGCFAINSGLSHVAIMQFYANLRGVDRSRTCNWALLVTMPVLVVMTLFDLVGIFTVGVGSVSLLTVISFLFGAVLSFGATVGGVTLIRFLSAKAGFVGFGYYSIGTGLLTFFLYLTV